MHIMVLGASGMIGHAICKVLTKYNSLEVTAVIRDRSAIHRIGADCSFSVKMNVIDKSELENLFLELRPDIVVNCIGITKHLPSGSDPLIAIPINAYFPHLLASISSKNNARLIHISSDCVFSGEKGAYSEEDIPDAVDIYGRTKALGEILGAGATTIRTSTIGHEIDTSYGLLEWFLKQQDSCAGFSKAIFSGLTTNELAKVIAEIIIPNTTLEGLYNIGGDIISKYDLLSAISHSYHKDIQILKSEEFVIDRSLDSKKFHLATGYIPPTWSAMIEEMNKFQRDSNV